MATRQVNRNAGQGATQFGALNNQLQHAIVNFSQLVAGATLFGQTVGAFREFEKQLVLTNSVAGGTVQQFRQMERSVRQFALSSMVSATEAASALYFLASAGFSVNESLSAMNGVLLLSQATLTDVAFTSDVIASNLRAFGLMATDTSRMANVFAAAITNSQATMDKLGFSMRQVAPAASAMGAELEEVTAQLSALYNIGLRGEQAGTQLRNIYVRLAKPVGEARDILRQFGIRTTEVNGELRDLQEILLDLSRAGLSTSQLAAIAGIEGVAGLEALIRSAASGNLQQLQNSITGTNRAFELFSEQINTFDGAAKLARNAINDLFISIGGAGAGTVEYFAMQIRELVLAFNALDPATQTLITQLIAGTAIFLAVATILKSVGGLLVGLIASFVRFGGVIIGTSTTVGVLSRALIALRAIMAGIIAINFAGIVQGIGLAALTAIPAVARLASALIPIAALSTAVTVAGLGAIGIALVGTGGVVWGVYSLVRAWNANKAASAASIQQAYDDLVRLNNLIDKTDTDRLLSRSSVALDRAGAMYAGNPGSGLDWANAVVSILRNTIEKEYKVITDELAILDQQLAANFPQDAQLKNLQRSIEHWQGLENDWLDNAPRVGPNSLSTPGLFIQQIRQMITQAEADILLLGDELADPANAPDYQALTRRINERREQLNDASQQFTRSFVELEEAYRQSFEDMFEGATDIQPFVKSGEKDRVLAHLREVYPALIQEFSSEIAAGNMDFLDLRQLFETVRTHSGTPAAIQDAIIDFATQQINQLYVDMGAVRAAARDRSREFALQIAQARAAANEELASQLEAIDLGERSSLIKVVRGIVKEQTDMVDGIFGEVVAFNRSLSPASAQIAAQLLISQRVAGLNLGEALSFDGFEKAIEDQADAFGLEGIEEFAAAKRDEYIALVNLILDEMLLAGEVANTVADTIRETLGASSFNLVEAVNAAVASLDSATQVATRRASKKGGGGGGGKDPVEEAKKARREFEDAFREIDKMRNQARRAQLEYGTFDITTRISILTELDTAETLAKYEDDLIRLRRELEDLNTTFKGQPLELDRLAAAYNEVIKQVEAARDAEIAYTNTFTAMVDRRNRAIDMQIDQLRNLSMEAEGAFNRINMGIMAGMLEYQRNMRTTVDNVAKATVGAMDALAEAVGAFVTGQGDFIEMLKAALLNVLRELITDATKRILQELMTGITEGFSSGAGGLVSGIASIFTGKKATASTSGGAAQGAASAAGGILSGVMGGGGIMGAVGGLFGMGGIGMGMAATPQVGGPFQQHLEMLSNGINQFNQGLGQVLSQFLQMLQTTLNNFNTQLNMALQQAAMRAGGGGGGGADGAFGGLGALFFTGLYDRGGSIPRGGFGIVGEKGPELVGGPASVIGRQDTASLFGGRTAENIEVPVTNIIVYDESHIARYLSSSAGERQINNIISRRERG